MDSILDSLKPTQAQNLIKLVEEAGFDISDWSNYKGGSTRAGANPKYCYEWCFVDGARCLVNIWYENCCENEGKITQDLNMRERAQNEIGPRKARALRFDYCVKKAFEQSANLRTVILDRPELGVGGVKRRSLDPVAWHVAKYDDFTGAFKLQRGERPQTSTSSGGYDPATQEYSEGEIRKKLLEHRRRERRARDAKIKQFIGVNGRLFCEVPECGFDFEKFYGDIGRGYAHVHHKVPLGSLPATGGTVSLKDLAIVCANCHAMIHRGGECRNLDEIIRNAPCSPRS